MIESPICEFTERPVFSMPWHAFHCEKAHPFCDTSQYITAPSQGVAAWQSYEQLVSEHTDSTVPERVSLGHSSASLRFYLLRLSEDKGFLRLFKVMQKFMCLAYIIVVDTIIKS